VRLASTLYDCYGLRECFCSPCSLEDHDGYVLGLWTEYDDRGKFIPFSVSQTATIPPDARLLKFWSSGSFEVKINDQVIVAGVPESEPPWSAQKSADIAAWSGQEVTLTLTTVNPMPFVPWWLIDNIRFEPIPEGGVRVLIALGGVVLWWWRRRSP